MDPKKPRTREDVRKARAQRTAAILEKIKSEEAEAALNQAKNQQGVNERDSASAAF